MESDKEGVAIGIDSGAAADSGSDGLTGAVESAIRYPAESEDVVKTVLIGGLLTLFSFLVVPVFVLAGYLVRVFDRTAAGDESPPTFDDFGELIVTGIKAIVVGIVYGFVPLFVGGLAVLVGVLGIGVGGDGPLAAIGVLGVLVGGVVWFALSLAVAYLVPAALANFARTRSIASGFDFETLTPIWRSRSYLLAWSTMFIVFLIGGILAAVLNVVPVLGTIASVFVGFYFSVAAYSAIGRSWGDFTDGNDLDHDVGRDVPSEPIR